MYSLYAAVCTAVYTCTRPAHGRVNMAISLAVYGPCSRQCMAMYMAASTAVYGPCTRSVYDLVLTVRCARRVFMFTTMYTACTRPCTRPPYTNSLCVYVHGHAHVYTAQTHPCSRPCTRPYGPCTRAHDRLHGCVWAVCMAVYPGLYTGRTCTAKATFW